MTNKYQGTCTSCHRTVAAGAGTCTKIGGRWAVTHTDCTSASTAAAPRTGWSNASRRYRPAAYPASDYAFSGDEAMYDEH